MNRQLALVVTSISEPTPALRRLAADCGERQYPLYVVGDAASPPEFHLENCSFFGLDRQAATGFRTAALCPQRHYARKNLGYLLAMREGARIIVETDDDNWPRPLFWRERSRRHTVPRLDRAGWVNVYAYFSDANIWPRGLPLDAVRLPRPAFDSLPPADADCPIQQGLVDDDPDVDAIYRLILAAPVKFASGRAVALGPGSWCPFNSQNTSWWPDAYPLLYLPAYCSFRMTDIWRGFLAQRIAWENGWSVLHREATVWHQRHAHDLLRDFQDEVPGYLHNRRVAETLEALSLAAGVEALGDNLRRCYEALVRLGLVDRRELPLLEAWLADLKTTACATPAGHTGDS